MSPRYRRGAVASSGWYTASMNVVVLGASGRTGRWVTRIAAERGHRVRAVAREGSAARVESADEVVTGEVLEREFVSRVLLDQDAVISTLGLNRASLNPWSRLLSPPDVVTRVMSSLAELCADAGSPRVVWMSAGGAGPSLASASLPIRAMIRAGNVGVAYRDLDAAERVMSASSVDAVAALPVTLLNGRSAKAAVPIRRYSLWSVVRRSAVARWMVGAAEASGPFDPPPLLIG